MSLNPEAMLWHEDVDIAIIAPPNHHVQPIAAHAVRACKHVITTGPLGSTAAEVRDLANYMETFSVQQRPFLLNESHELRYLPSVRRLAEALDSGEIFDSIGNIQRINVRWDSSMGRRFGSLDCVLALCTTPMRSRPSDSTRTKAPKSGAWCSRRASAMRVVVELSTTSPTRPVAAALASIS